MKLGVAVFLLVLATLSLMPSNVEAIDRLGPSRGNNKWEVNCTTEGPRCGDLCEGFRLRGACYCDARCLLYRDCCEDFEQNCPVKFQEGELLKKRYPHLRPVCEADKGGKLLTGCPASLGDSHPLVRKCAEGSKMGDVSYHPVESRGGGGLHFVNSFCARCNGHDDEMVKWPLHVYFDSADSPQLENPILAETELKAFLDRDANTANVSSGMLWKWEASLDRRSCIPSAERSCPGFASDSPEALACAAFTSYVAPLNSTRRFQNRHCLLCNGFQMCAIAEEKSTAKGQGDFSNLFKWSIENVLDTGDNHTLDLSSLATSWTSKTCYFDSRRILCEIKRCRMGYYFVKDSCQPHPSNVTLTLRIQFGRTSIRSGKFLPRGIHEFNRKYWSTMIVGAMCKPIVEKYKDVQNVFSHFSRTKDYVNLTALFRFSSVTLTEQILIAGKGKPVFQMGSFWANVTRQIRRGINLFKSGLLMRLCFEWNVKFLKDTVINLVGPTTCTLKKMPMRNRTLHARWDPPLSCVPVCSPCNSSVSQAAAKALPRLSSARAVVVLALGTTFHLAVHT